MKLSKQKTGTTRGFRLGVGWGGGEGGGEVGTLRTRNGRASATGIRGHAPPENFNLGVLKG